MPRAMPSDYIVFPSSRSLLVVGIIAAILSPLVGVILGAYFWARPQLAREGKVVVSVALIWLAVILANLIVF